MSSHFIRSLRLAVVFCLALVLSATRLQAANFQNQPVKPPNIVVFLVDDMGVMDTSVPFLTDAAGKPKRYPLNDYYITPSMERLAKQGIRFNHFYAMSVCSPTRISIMSGQNAARHHATNWINPRKNNAGPQGPPDWNWEGLNKEDITLPRLLAKAGYRTIHVGKGHFGADGFAGAEPLNLGFDVNIAGSSFGAPGSYYGMKKFGLGTRRAHHAVPHLEKYHDTDIFLTEALTLEANATLAETVKTDQPFFLYMAHYAVHAPFESDPRFAAHYQDSGKPAPAQAFATLIEGMDKSLGDIMNQLNQLGVAENTLIFFLGDNGSDAPLGHQHDVACAAPLRGKKGAHYEGGMRVPFIAAWAKPDPSNPNQKLLPIPQDALQTQIAAVHDLFPTILKVTDVKPPQGYIVDGQPLNQLLTGKSDEAHRDTFLMHYPHSPHRSNYFTVYRDGDWKVIYHYVPSPDSEDSHYQLYNLAKDPFEQHNLAESEPKQLKQMMQALIDSMEQHAALYPVTQESNKPMKPKMP